MNRTHNDFSKASASALKGWQSPAAASSAGPGWFESSWDLARGLDVREGMPDDQTLDEWLTIGMLLA